MKKTSDQCVIPVTPWIVFEETIMIRHIGPTAESGREAVSGRRFAWGWNCLEDERPVLNFEPVECL